MRIAGVRDRATSARSSSRTARPSWSCSSSPSTRAYLKEDATALLRTKTGLRTCSSRSIRARASRSRRTAGSRSRTPRRTSTPTRCSPRSTPTRATTCKLLISGAGKGLEGRGDRPAGDVRAPRPAEPRPRARHQAVARRRAEPAPLVNKYGLLTTELGKGTGRSCGWSSTSNAALGAFASEDAEHLRARVASCRGRCDQTEPRRSRKVDTLGGELGPTLEALRPPFRKLDEANRAVLPFVREATPILETRSARSRARRSRSPRDLGAASRDLAQAAPDLTTAFHKLNRLFNIGAYNPGGTEGSRRLRDERRLTRTERARDEGYLYWLAWVGQNTVSLFSHRRRARARSGACTWQPELRHVQAARPSHGGRAGRPIGRRACADAVRLDLGRARTHDQADPQPRPARGDGRVHHVVLRHPAVPVAGLRRLDPAQAGGLPVRGRLPRGRDAADGGRRAHGRRERRQGQDEGAGQGRRAHGRRDGDREAYAPIPKDSRAILRQKTLLGETYVELTPGHRSGAGCSTTAGGCRTPQVEPTVELDEIFTAFDDPTPARRSRTGSRSSRGAIEGGRGAGPERRVRATSRASPWTAPSCCRCSTSRSVAVRRLVKNTGRGVRGDQRARGRAARPDRERQRRFEATASRDEALAETFQSSRPSSTSRRRRWRGWRASRGTPGRW